MLSTWNTIIWCAYVYVAALCLSAPGLAQSTEGAWSAVANIPGCTYWAPHKPYEDPAKTIPTTWSGACEDGHVHGHGTLVFKDRPSENGFMEGEFGHGRLSGLGTFEASTMLENGPFHFHYEGMFLNSVFHGRGVMLYEDGARYEGEFKDGKVSGRGVAVLANARRYEGVFKGGGLQGKGVLVYPNGNRYEGEFINSAINGQG